MRSTDAGAPQPARNRRTKRHQAQPPSVLLLSIGVDADGHICKREGFLRPGTRAQMETARHISYLLDELGRAQQEAEWGRPILPLEAVTGWQLAGMIEHLRQERKERHE